MREIIERYRVYDIDDLKEFDQFAYQNAIEKACEQWNRDMIEFDWEELKQSMFAFAGVFGLKITDWSVGLFSYNNYIQDNSDDYIDFNDSEVINDDVQELNSYLNDDTEILKLTGVWTDLIVFQYFKDNNITAVTYNNIHKHLEEVLNYALQSFIEDCENSLLDENMIREYIINNDMEFTEDGEIHY